MPEQIRLVDIEPNPNNPRKHFDNEKLESLAQSIKEHGIIQALVVTPLPATEGQFQRYRLICGERRLRAAKMLGMATVPADVQDTFLLPSVEAERMLIENIQRQDLDPIEEARAYQALLKEHGHTQEALGVKLGFSQGHIANRLRLLDLPDSIQENISRGIISPSHGRILTGHKNLPEVVLQKAAKSIADNAVPVSRAAAEVYKAIAEQGRELRKYMAEFEMVDCEGCQHFALGSRSVYNDKPDDKYCLNHQCYDKKQAEAKEARETEITRKAEGLLKQGQQAVDLTHIGHGNYEQINSYGKTEIDAAECKECESRALGKVSYDTELREVCLKPSCYRKKKMAREKGKEVRNALQEELNQVAILAGLKAASMKRWEPGDGRQVDTMFVMDRPTLIYIAGSILGSLGSLQDRPTLYRYLNDKYGCNDDVLKRGGWGMLNDEWDAFRKILETLTDQQLLKAVFEWPAVALGLKGAPEWILQLEPKEEQPGPDLVHALLGRTIKTHYNTGGVVTNVNGPKKDGFYTVNYKKNLQDRKFSNLNSITFVDGVILCEGIPLTILDEDKSMPEEQTETEECGSYVCELTGNLKQCGTCANTSEDKKCSAFGFEVSSLIDLQRCSHYVPGPTPVQLRRYLDERGREIFVSTGLGSEYGTFWCSEKGGLHRVKSPAMPMMSSQEEAQANLDAWAAKKGLQPVDGNASCEQTA